MTYAENTHVGEAIYQMIIRGKASPTQYGATAVEVLDAYRAQNALSDELVEDVSRAVWDGRNTIDGSGKPVSWDENPEDWRVIMRDDVREIVAAYLNRLVARNTPVNANA